MEAHHLDSTQDKSNGPLLDLVAFAIHRIVRVGGARLLPTNSFYRHNCQLKFQPD